MQDFLCARRILEYISKTILLNRKWGCNMSRNTNSQVRAFNRFMSDIFPRVTYDYTDKSACMSQHVLYMLNRTQAMFRWSGLPDSIPARILELYLQINGNVCFYRYNSELYVFTGGLGGEPDVYYRPTLYTVANPALKLLKSLRIGIDCVVMPNDSLYVGLLPLYNRYAAGLVENELSMRLATINSRIVDLISAPDDRSRASAEKYLADIVEGKIGIIAENVFLDGIRAQPYGNTSNSNVLTNLIEMEQYLRAGWFNDIGLNANYNMKRESLSTTESQMNNDALLPLVDNMLECRQIAARDVNRMFGTDISVELTSSWQDNQIELDVAQKSISGQPENNIEDIGNDTE